MGRIGFGFHGPAVMAHKGYTLTAVVDPLEQRRREVSAAWSVPAFASLQELLAAERVDVVVIASPTNLHAEHARLAFQHGAHVLCDKPVATSVAEFDGMLDAARAANRRFVAYQPARFLGPVLALRELLRRDVLGPLHYIKRSRCSYLRRYDWQAQRIHGGGMLNNWGPHCIDEIISVLPKLEIRRVFCQTNVVASVGDAEDFVKATFVADSGLVIDLDVSQATPLSAAPWEVRGKFGSAIFDAATRMWKARYYDPTEAPPPPKAETVLAASSRSYGDDDLPWKEITIAASDFPEPDYYEMAHQYFRTGENPPVTPAESRLVLELIARCRESSAV